MSKFSEEYYDLQYNRFSNYFKNLFSEIVVSGTENFKLDSNNVILVPTHRSEYDQIIVGYVFYERFNRMIKAIGGNNLLIPGITSPLFGQTLVLDCQKVGMIPVDRKKISKSKSYFSEFKETLLESEISKYPLFVTIQDGRTKSGIIEEPQTGLLNLVTKILGKDNTAIYPIVIDYDRVFEDWTFEYNTIFKNKLPNKMAGFLNSMMDLYSIISNRKSKSNCYFQILPALYPSDYKNIKDLGNDIKKMQDENIVVTAPSLYSYSKTHNLSLSDVLKSAESNNIRLGKNTNSKFEIVEFVNILFDDINPFMLNYYSNYCANKFK